MPSTWPPAMLCMLCTLLLLPLPAAALQPPSLRRRARHTVLSVQDEDEELPAHNPAARGLHAVGRAGERTSTAPRRPVEAQEVIELPTGTYMRQLLHGCHRRSCMGKCPRCTFPANSDVGHCRNNGRINACFRQRYFASTGIAGFSTLAAADATPLVSPMTDPDSGDEGDEGTLRNEGDEGDEGEEGDEGNEGDEGDEGLEDLDYEGFEEVVVPKENVAYDLAYEYEPELSLEDVLPDEILSAPAPDGPRKPRLVAYAKGAGERSSAAARVSVRGAGRGREQSVAARSGDAPDAAAAVVEGDVEVEEEEDGGETLEVIGATEVPGETEVTETAEVPAATVTGRGYRVGL